MPPAKAITPEQFDELKKQVNNLTSTVNDIQKNLVGSIATLSGSVKNIESMMKSGFGDGKEQCFGHRQNIQKDIDKLAETLEKHSERIGEVEKKSAANQVIIGIVTALITAVVTTILIKFIP